MRNKIKRFSIIFGTVFFICVALLTYFASTIEYMLLPRVSVADINAGSLTDGTDTSHGVFLVPINAVIEDESGAQVFVVRLNSENMGTVFQVPVEIRDQNHMYYEVNMDDLFAGYSVIYEVSRDLKNYDKVIVEEEE